MRTLKVLLITALMLVATGCTCRTNADGDNIPLGGENGPFTDVNFAFDSYALDATAKSIISSNYKYLTDNAGVSVVLEGHCDERGTNEYNMALGNKRSQAVYDYVKSLGLNASRASTMSYGEELPLDPGHNEAAWAKNRRVHFSVKK